MKTNAELIEIAEKATPGEWERQDKDICAFVPEEGEVCSIADTICHLGDAKANAVHIAAFNPATCLRILKENEKMKDALELISATPMFNGGCKMTYDELGKEVVNRQEIAKRTLLSLASLGEKVDG